MSDAPTIPVVLDTGVLIEIARGDLDLIKFILHYDARGQAMVMPTLAVAAASLDSRSEESADLLTGLELLAGMTVAPLSGVGQAAKLADVIARTDLDPWDAHVAAVADAATCPILTLDGGKWRGASAELDQPLHVMEIADPDDGGGPQAG
jgi:predicted nucleic acid-binding protein